MFMTSLFTVFAYGGVIGAFTIPNIWVDSKETDKTISRE